MTRCTCCGFGRAPYVLRVDGQEYPLCDVCADWQIRRGAEERGLGKRGKKPRHSTGAPREPRMTGEVAPAGEGRCKHRSGCREPRVAGTVRCARHLEMVRTAQRRLGRSCTAGSCGDVAFVCESCRANLCERHVAKWSMPDGWRSVVLCRVCARERGVAA